MGNWSRVDPSKKDELLRNLYRGVEFSVGWRFSGGVDRNRLVRGAASLIGEFPLLPLQAFDFAGLPERVIIL
jgi:hypothetical protein